MLQNKASLSWLANPEVFAVGREPAHSDHFYFASEKEMEEWKDLGTNCSTSFRQSLDGSWKFFYAENPSMRIVDFYREDYDCSEFGSRTYSTAGLRPLPVHQYHVPVGRTGVFASAGGQ